MKNFSSKRRLLLEGHQHTERLDSETHYNLNHSFSSPVEYIMEAVV